MRQGDRWDCGAVQVQQDLLDADFYPRDQRMDDLAPLEQGQFYPAFRKLLRSTNQRPLRRRIQAERRDGADDFRLGSESLAPAIQHQSLNVARWDPPAFGLVVPFAGKERGGHIIAVAFAFFDRMGWR